MKYSLIATWNMSLKGMKIARDILEHDGLLKDALIKGINDVENDPKFHSVGFGGLPDLKGRVTCDAAYMNGDNLKFGAVGCVTGIKNLVNVAELLSHEDRNNFLVGDGALRYALNHGFSEEELLTKEAFEIYEKALVKEEELHPYHDTVCFIGMKDGHMAIGTSTSGLFLKHPGRIGDSPICGAGFYCDSKVGACAVTGMGEDVQRSLLSYRCVSLMRDKMSANDACEKTLKEVEEVIPDIREVSLITMDKDGNIGVATNTDFAYTYASDNLEAKAECIRLSKDNRLID